MIKIEDETIEMSGHTIEIMSEATMLFLCSVDMINQNLGKKEALSYLEDTAKVLRDVTDAIMHDKNIYESASEGVKKHIEEILKDILDKMD